MKNYATRRFGLIVCSLLILLKLSAQPLSTKSTTENPVEFLKKLGEFVTLNKQDVSLKSFQSFEKKFRSGGFSQSEQQRIITTCNQMQELRFNAAPYFVDYLQSAATVSSNGDGKESSKFELWQDIVEDMLKAFQQDRKFEPIQRFLSFSTDFLEKNALFLGTNSVNWFIDNGDYIWKCEKGTPSVSWLKVRLSAGYKKDSIEIKDTKGTFYPVTGQWKGVHAKILWDRFKNDEIYCDINDYTIDVSRGFYHVEKAKLHYPVLLDNDILGSFDDKVNFSKAENEDSYPRFESYEKRLKISNIGTNITYEGGFRLFGMTVYGYGTKDEKASITIADGKTGKRAFRSAALQYAIRKGESINAEAVESAIYFGKDSIYHPSVNLRMDVAKNTLTLTRGERGSQRNPFFNSYHHINMEMTKIKWLLDKDSIVLGDKQPGYGINSNDALFESFQFFSEPDFRRFQNIATRNPIAVLKMYGDQVGKRIVKADDAMRQINPKMDAGMVQSLISDLVSQGFVNYDPESNLLDLKDKIFHYTAANQKKVDYDVLRFKSETKEENAFFTLKDSIIQARGVKGVELSTKQRVRAVPSNEIVLLKRNRDFDFDGRIYAGFTVLHGKKYHFNYDRFDIVLDSVRYLDLYLKTGEDAYKRPIATALNSRIEHLSGALIIDAATNKSGREDIKMFPSLQSKTNSYVYYDAPSTQDTCYKRDSFYFKLNKFNLDGIDSLVREQIKFKGTMVSNIFSNFQEVLTVQSDSSLGFINRSPTEGYPTYGNKGTFQGEISLNNKGFIGKGLIKYLDAQINAKDIIFRPKQMTCSAEVFDMQENRTSKVPHITAPGVNINWLPKRDSMYLTVNGDTAFSFFNNGDYKMRRTIIVTPSGVKGIGTFDWEKGTLQSKLFSFGSNSIQADTMQLSIKVLNKAFSEQLALNTNNIKGEIDFDKQKGRFKSNAETEMTNMPGIKYKTTVNEFEWNLGEESIQFLPKGLARFICTDVEQDNLEFYGKIASYDLKINNLKIGGTEHISTCDAFIFPFEQKLQVDFGGKMTTLENAKIVCDTVTQHHVINRATVTIKGRKDYTASGFYEYNVVGKQQEIKFDNIIGQRVGKGAKNEKRTETQATGTVKEEDNFHIDHKTVFKGTISLFSASKNLRFEGFAKLEHENLPDKQWFTVNSASDKSDLALRYSAPKNEAGELLSTGIFISKENSGAYPRVMMPLMFRKDRVIMDVKGVFKYDNANDELIFGDSSRVLTDNLRGSKLVYNNRLLSVIGEGKLGLGSALQSVKIVASGRAKTAFLPVDAQTNDSSSVSGSPLSIEAMIGLDLHVPDKILKIMGADIQAGSFDAPEADFKKDDFTEKALTEFIKDEKEYQRTLADMRSRTLSLPDKYNKFSFLISRMSMRWNEELQSFVSYGTKADLNSIFGININKKLTMILEVKMPSNEDDRVYFYIKTANEFIYFFGYQKGILEICSTNPRVEEEFKKMKPKDRTRKMEGGTSLEMEWGDIGKAEMFVRRVQQAQGR